MTKVLWSNTFRRALRRTLRRHPQSRPAIDRTLRDLALDPFAPHLATHKLKGKLQGVWAASAGFDLRILFDFVPADDGGDHNISLLTIGSHDEVY